MFYDYDVFTFTIFKKIIMARKILSGKQGA